MQRYAAIVLAGGAGRRLGGVDKAEITVGGASLLRWALAATARADPPVVVGPVDRRIPVGVLSAQESPPGGGPAAAIAAGLSVLQPDDTVDVVVVLACDMPLVDLDAVERLVAELADSPDVDAVMYADGDGRRQYLAAAYRIAALRGAIAADEDPSGASMRSVVARLTVAEIAAHPDLTLDIDTWEDIERTRQILEDR